MMIRIFLLITILFTFTEINAAIASNEFQDVIDQYHKAPNSQKLKFKRFIYKALKEDVNNQAKKAPYRIDSITVITSVTFDQSGIIREGMEVDLKELSSNYPKYSKYTKDKFISVFLKKVNNQEVNSRCSNIRHRFLIDYLGVTYGLTIIEKTTHKYIGDILISKDDCKNITN